MLSRKRVRSFPPPTAVLSEMDTSDSLIPAPDGPTSHHSVINKILKRVRKNTQPGELRLLRDLEDLVADEKAGRIRLKFAAPTAIEATIFLDASSIVSVLVLIDRYYPHKAPQVHCLAFGSPSQGLGGEGGGGGELDMQGTIMVKALANSFPRPAAAFQSIHGRRAGEEEKGGGGGGKEGHQRSEEDLDLVHENDLVTSSSAKVKLIDHKGMVKMMNPADKVSASKISLLTSGEEGEGDEDEVMDGLLAAFSGAFSSETEEIVMTDKQQLRINGSGTTSMSMALSSSVPQGKEIIDDDDDDDDDDESEYGKEKEGTEEESKIVIIEAGKRIELPLLSKQTWSPVFTLKEVLESVANEARLRL